MKTLLILTLTVVGLASCNHTPDLTVMSVTPNSGWATGTHSVDVTIKNIGNGDAGNFWLYVDAQNNSTTVGAISSQSTQEYSSLAVGASAMFHVDFDTNPFVQGHSIADVINILATVDAKTMVEERDESNNKMQVNVP